MLRAEGNTRLPVELGLQLAERQVRAPLKNLAQYTLIDLALGPGPVRWPFHHTGALAHGGDLPCPTLAYPKTLRQLRQASLALVMRLQKLPPQIIRICSRHIVYARKIAISTLHYREKCSRNAGPSTPLRSGRDDKRIQCV